MRKIIAAAVVLFLVVPVLAQSDLKETGGRTHYEDWAPIKTCREGMGRIVDYLKAGHFREKDLLPADQREDLKGTWKSFLDFVCALDVVGNELEGTSVRVDTLWDLDGMAYAAFLTQYRYSLEFLRGLDKIPGADKLLNEAMPELGLKKDSLASFKFRFLNVAQAAKFAAYQVTGKERGSKLEGKWKGILRQDEKALWSMGVGKGTVMTLKNGKAILAKGVFKAWFPTQKGVSSWMGDTKVWRVHEHLISDSQVGLLKRKLEPGDILFARHEWYLSNLGLPGFWSHAALYIGDVETRRAFFDDPEVRAWVEKQGVKGNVEDLLRSKTPGAYQLSLALDKKNHVPRILEAISDGVVYSTLETFSEADSISAIRPRLSKVEKARAILRAFGYSGRPYDFNFDFQSDDTLVCSEVVYKSYEPAEGYKGLTFPLQNMMGRVVSSPNGMVEQFSEQYGSKDQQSDFAVFLDGHEKKGKAFEAGQKEFRKSWKRPKWNVFLQ